MCDMVVMEMDYQRLSVCHSVTIDIADKVKVNIVSSSVVNLQQVVRNAVYSHEVAHKQSIRRQVVGVWLCEHRFCRPNKKNAVS